MSSLSGSPVGPANTKSYPPFRNQDQVQSKQDLRRCRVRLHMRCHCLTSTPDAPKIALDRCGLRWCPGVTRATHNVGLISGSTGNSAERIGPRDPLFAGERLRAQRYLGPFGSSAATGRFHCTRRYHPAAASGVGFDGPAASGPGFNGAAAGLGRPAASPTRRFRTCGAARAASGACRDPVWPVSSTTLPI
jgi:hypothetical protein